MRGGLDPARKMDLATFDRIAEELLPCAEWARLNGLGEATILPDFAEYRARLERYALRKEIVTNLMADDETVVIVLLILIFG